MLRLSREVRHGLPKGEQIVDVMSACNDNRVDELFMQLKWPGARRGDWFVWFVVREERIEGLSLIRIDPRCDQPVASAACCMVSDCIAEKATTVVSDSRGATFLGGLNVLFVGAVQPAAPLARRPD